LAKKFGSRKRLFGHSKSGIPQPIIYFNIESFQQKKKGAKYNE
jgi:hypothetical protein